MWRHILSSSSYAPGLIPLPRLFLAGAILLTVGGPAMPANPMPMPPLAAVERGAYRARDLQTGEEVSQAEWTLNQETLAGRPIVLLRENGKETGRRTGLAVWSDEMRLDLWGAHPVLTSTREVRDTDGRPVRVQQRQFDYNTGSGQVVTEEPLRGAHDARLVAVSSQAVTSELVPAILRLLPETRYRQMRFDLITPEGWTIGMRARIVGREWVTVPAGRYECFKMELEPTGLLGFLTAFKLSKIFMWHTVTAPHFWVKYEGPEGSAGSRQVIRELTRFETTLATALALRSAPASSKTD